MDRCGRGRAATTALVAALLALSALACGGDDEAGSSTAADGRPATTDGSATGSTGGAFPMAIDHRFGTTTLETAPERIVALTGPYIDALLAVDVAPTAVGVDPVAGDLMPWQVDLPDDVELIEIDATDYSVSPERLLTLAPDVILAGALVIDDAGYQALSRVAPTVPALSDDGFVDSWQEQTLLVGDLTGRTAAAQEAIAATEDGLVAAGAEHPGLDGRRFAVAGYLEPGSIDVVSNPDDTTNQLFSALGLELDPGVVGLDGGQSGVQGRISIEQIDLLDTDLLTVIYFSPDAQDELEGEELFSDLEVVRDGRYLGVDLLTGFALRSPTVASTPWVLDCLAPLLEVFDR